MSAFLLLQSMGLATGLLLIIINHTIIRRKPGHNKRGFLLFFISYTLHCLFQGVVYLVHYSYPETSYDTTRIITLLYYVITGTMVYSGPYFCHRLLGLNKRREIPFIILFAIYEILVMVNLPYIKGQETSFIHTNILFNLTMFIYPVVFSYMTFMIIRKKAIEFRPKDAVIFQTFMIFTLILLGVFMGTDLFQDKVIRFNGLSKTLIIDTLLYIAVSIKYLSETMQILLPKENAVRLHSYNSMIVSTYNLSQREKEVFSHMIRGLSYKEIGDKLNISESTIKTHMNRIFHKSGCSNRTELLHTVLQ